MRDIEQLLGIFARTFVRPNDPAAVARAISEAHFPIAQLNLNAVGHPTLPPDAHRVPWQEIAGIFGRHGVAIWGLSATYNMIDRDQHRRLANTRIAQDLIQRTPQLGAGVVTLCTGSRDPDNMWRAHPLNRTLAAWTDFRRSLDPLLLQAGRMNVRLGIEPEPGNVISDADRAVRLLAELGEDADTIGIVLDPANLITGHDIRDQRRILSDAFEKLADQVVALHAKDVRPDGTHCAVGLGALDYELIFSLYRDLPSSVPIIVQDVEEPDVTRVREHLVQAWRSVQR